MELFINYFLIFIIGSILGFIIELFYRRYFSVGSWINPGFLTGPWQPLYGFGILILYLVSSLEISIYYKLLLILVLMTLIEYITGLIFIKFFKIKLWDYSNKKFNIQGIISLEFSFYWLILGVIYIFLINPRIVSLISILDYTNILFIFFMGGLFSLIIFDFLNSMNFAREIKKLYIKTKESIHFEQFKLFNKLKHKNLFILPIRAKDALIENVNEFLNKIKEKIKK